MATRRDIGRSWAHVVRDWYLDAEPAIDAEEGWKALGILERHLPTVLDDLLTSGARRPESIAWNVDLGVTLLKCLEIDGFGDLLATMKRPGNAGISEAVVLRSLIELGYKPRLYRPVGGKCPDACVMADGQEVFIETTSPEWSEEQRRLYDGMRQLLDGIKRSEPGAFIEVYLVTDPSTKVRESVMDFLRSERGRMVGVTHSLPDVAFVRRSTLANPTPPSFRPDGVPRSPILSVDHDGVVVRLPFADPRADKIMSREREQLSRGTSNLVVIDVSIVPDAINTWLPLIERRLQETLNRRVGAVGLLDTTVRKSAVYRRWRVVRHPNPYRPVPETFLNGIESLDQGDQFRERR
jgi:hypothetical protein